MKGEYRPEIDGLRAVAVLAATFNNFWEEILPCGYLGVDMFAVISGYVITASLYGREQNSLREFLTTFYSRRCKRLIPALVFMVVGICIVSPLIIPEDYWKLVFRSGASSVVGLSNFYLIKNSSDYFSLAAKLNPFTATWSLSCEEQWYLVFPLLAWVSGFSSSLNSGTRRLALMILCLSVASFVAFTWLWHTSPTNAYYLMPTRLWEIGAGCLACLCYESRIRGKSTWNSRYFGEVILLCLVTTLFAPLASGLIATYLVVLLTVLLILFHNKNSVLNALLCCKPFSFIARISYSLYLWRWATISLLLWGFGDMNNWIRIVGISIMFTLAVFSTFVVEEPFRKVGRFSDLHSIFLPLAAFCSALALIVSGKLLTSKDGAIFENWVGTKLDCHDPHDNFTELKVKHCFARAESKPVVFVIGSSHAMNLVQSIKGIYMKLGYSQVLYFRHTHVGKKKRDFAIAELSRQLSKGDLLIYSRDQDSFIANSDLSVKRALSAIDDLNREIELLAEIVRSRNSKLILVDDLPSFKQYEFGDTHFSRLIDRRTGISLGEALVRRKDYTKILNSHVDGEHVFLIDPIRSVCHAKWCGTKMHGKELYIDSSPHIHVINATILSDFFQIHLPRVQQKDHQH